jgi:MYXO-CTERM domain-containing protein
LTLTTFLGFTSPVVALTGENTTTSSTNTTNDDGDNDTGKQGLAGLLGLMGLLGLRKKMMTTEIPIQAAIVNECLK